MTALLAQVPVDVNLLSTIVEGAVSAVALYMFATGRIMSATTAADISGPLKAAVQAERDRADHESAARAELEGLLREQVIPLVTNAQVTHEQVVQVMERLAAHLEARR